MKNCAPEKIRNFVLAGHSGAGKTSLTDLLLFKAGAVPRLGSVDAGTSVSDFKPEEQDRKYSFYTSMLHCGWGDGHFFFADTPGAPAFIGEAINVINVADLMVLVVDAVDGLGPNTISAWKQARERKMPRMIFINGCDKPEANVAATIELLRTNYGRTLCVPCTLPIGEAEAFKGVASVLGTDLPAEVAAEAEEFHHILMDTIAESDEELMMQYLDSGTLSDEEIATGFRKAVLSGSLIPIFVGSVAKDKGIQELGDAIMAYGPSPLDAVPVNLSDGELDRTAAEAVGVVFKSVNDPFIGQMSYIRVFSGTLKPDSELVNLTKGSKERFGNIMQIQGKEQTPIDQAGAGEIIAIAKLKNTGLNDVLSSKDSSLRFAPVVYPQPTTKYAISATNKGEDDKVATGLARLTAEDPTLHVERDPETHQTVLSGMGDRQIDVVVARLKNEFKVGVTLDTPRVPYRETVTMKGEAQFRHKKQSGGHGQFAEVHLRLEPYTPAEGEPDFVFANEVVGGSIPKNYIPAVEKGVNETRECGPISRSKVINFKATVYDGKYHDVDSSEMAFKIATRGAFKAAMENAKPMLLEPIMSLRIIFPDIYMGAISGDLNSRRGRILGMDRDEGLQVVIAEVPLAEVFSYPRQLRSMTAGRGTFEMKFERYDPVPTQLMNQIKAESDKLAEEEDE